MNFEALRRRVERAERLAGRRMDIAAGHRDSLRQEWKAAWTPGRIVVLGLLAGVLVSRARPLRVLAAVSATRWVQLATSLSGLFASLRARDAAESAEAAATDAGNAAGQAADTMETVAGRAPEATATSTEDTAAPRSVSDGRRRPDPQWEQAPHPAEAATELSER